jgi:hypothetical protein
MIHLCRQVQTALAQRLWDLHQAVRADDRGDFASGTAWVGLMVLAAVTIAGIITGKAEDFANSIDFGP